MDAWLRSVMKAVVTTLLAVARDGVGQLPWFLRRLVEPLLDEAVKNVDAIVEAILRRFLQELGSLPPAEFGALPPDLQAVATAGPAAPNP